MVGSADLFQQPWPSISWFPFANDLAPGEHTIKILPVGEKSPESAASQVLFHELVITRSCRPGEVGGKVENTNRVLPIFPAVLEIMKQVPREGLILDCGCADRILDDPRYIGLDYEQYQLPSVYGDALKLPFKDNAFDLTFCQALLEHVRDPFKAVAEMGRITKPGGVVWAGMAFMQPVHGVPSHYFNATVWGIQELFRDLDIVKSSWFGELSFTIDWLLKASGVAGKVDPATYADLSDRIKSLDQFVSYEDLKAVASGVAVHAVKRI
jgi:SAM-dependent methyltransferase